jgi:hypothetical protein
MATKTRVGSHGGPTHPLGGTNSGVTAATTTCSRQARSGVAAASPSGRAISAATGGTKISHSRPSSTSSWVLSRNAPTAASHRMGAR